MTLPTSGQLSIEDLKKELRIDLPTGVGPTAFDLSENLQLLLARTKPGAANKNFPLILPDDFWGTRRPNDPIDFSSQIAGGVFTRNFTATRATEGATTIRFKVWRAGNVLHGQIVDKGAVSTTFGIIPAIATSYAGVTDDHDIEVKIDLLSGSPSVAPVYGVFKVADATAQEIEVTYPGPYIGSKLISFRLTVRQRDLPANTFQAVMSLVAENTFVPETPYAPGADLNKGMWANVVTESDAYTHAIYSFVLRNGDQGYGYYLWRNSNGSNGFDEYHFLGLWKDFDTLQFNIGVNSFNQTGGLGNGVPVGSWAFRNGAVNWAWQDITTTEKGIHVIGNRRYNGLNLVVQVRSRNTGRVYQTVNIVIAAEVTIQSWSMPVTNFPKAMSSSTSANINVRSGVKIYRDPSSGQILFVPVIRNGTQASFWNWTGGSGYMNGNVPLTNRVVPDARLSLTWDTGGSGCQTFNGAQSGSILLTGHNYNSCPEFYGIERGVNGSYNESVWLAVYDTWTGAAIWSGHQIIFNQSRSYNPPPPATQFDHGMLATVPTNLTASDSGGTSGSASAGAGFGIGWNDNYGGITFITGAAGSYSFIATANVKGFGGAFGDTKGYPNGKIISNSDNFDIRIYCESGSALTSSNGLGYRWRSQVMTMRANGSGDSNGLPSVNDSGWVYVGALRAAGGKSALIVDASVSAGHRERGSCDSTYVVQFRDRASGNIVATIRMRVAVSASGGTSNDR